MEELESDRRIVPLGFTRRGPATLSPHSALLLSDIEGEEDCAEEGCGLFVRIGLETRVDVDDEGRTDSGEQTRLQEWVRLLMRTNDKDDLRK